MQVELFLGQYAVSITGPETITDHLPLNWQRFQKKQQESYTGIRIRIEEDNPCLDVQSCGDRWSFLKNDSYRQVLYSSEGQAVFAIRNGAVPNEVTVCVHEGKSRSSQYGVIFGILLAVIPRSIGLHGVTLLCGDEIVILSAPSGTGKTTLSRLLEQYGDAIVLNGDFSILTPTQDGVFFEPTPFCGSSGRCLNHRVRVSRVVFLGQSETNYWRAVTGREALTRFMSNAFVPTWDECVQQAVQASIVKCISALNVNMFTFAPTREAAELFCQSIAKS